MKPPFGGFDGDHTHPNREYVVATNTGFRRWYLEDWDKPLRSMSWSYYWKGRGPHRSLYANGNPSDVGTGWAQEYPQTNNPVGFYAYYRTDSSIYPGYPEKGMKMRVDGLIEGYGRCVIGDKGFRAEVAVILAFCLDGLQPMYDGQILRNQTETAQEIKDRLERTYDYLDKTYPLVPIFDTRKDMLAMFPLSRKPVFTDDPRDPRRKEV